MREWLQLIFLVVSVAGVLALTGLSVILAFKDFHAQPTQNGASNE